MTPQSLTLYWDSSAIVLALTPGPDHEVAQRLAMRPGTHVMSSLALAEVLAAIHRLRRDGDTSTAAVALDEVQRPPWKRIQESPDSGVLQEMAAKWALRGADLWHLALARTLQHEQPALRLLSFDRRLAEAATGEGLAASRSLL